MHQSAAHLFSLKLCPVTIVLKSHSDHLKYEKLVRHGIVRHGIVPLQVRICDDLVDSGLHVRSTIMM